MNRRFMLVAMLVSTLLFAPGLQAQTRSGKPAGVIKGTVVGADGKAVPAATVTCQSSAGIHPRIVHTDAKGHFAVIGLKWDNYDIRATANGAYSDWEKNFVLHTGETREITLYLLNGNTAISGQLPKKHKN